MTEQQIISWIFMATAIASQTKPTDFKGISDIADGINHAVPTHKEMQTSISWLFDKGLVSKHGREYTLTPKGKSEYKNASGTTNILLKIWKNLEEKIKNYA
ncbi:hypothetical protein OO009_00030 [Flavobacteriaceae bacterium KMM 6897]|nr:hypothetical protein [Flavobacteriaceae bacterium KMM 6897]MEB8345774.1 hypothetical protein [Flavobacteriaceae bacterium KMM 6898]